MAIFPKLQIQHNPYQGIPIKIQATLSNFCFSVDSKTCMEMQRTLETVKTTLTNKKKVGGVTLPDLQISSKYGIGIMI